MSLLGEIAGSNPARVTRARKTATAGRKPERVWQRVSFVPTMEVEQ